MDIVTAVFSYERVTWKILRPSFYQCLALRMKGKYIWYMSMMR